MLESFELSGNGRFGIVIEREANFVTTICYLENGGIDLYDSLLKTSSIFIWN
jgi:hypothetical protein